VAIQYDEIGIWSEVKLAIVREYAAAYSRIMEATRRNKLDRLSWIYVDAYAGPGYHLSKKTGETVEGSPLIALNTAPPFCEYHFIDTEPARAEPMKTKNNAVTYYLYFASQKPAALNIVNYIFRKYGQP